MLLLADMDVLYLPMGIYMYSTYIGILCYLSRYPDILCAARYREKVNR